MSGQRTHFDAVIASNVSVTSGDTTVRVNAQPYARLEAFGTCTTGTGTITLQCSIDDSNWYDTAYQITTTAGSDFFGHFNVSAPFYRFRYDQNMTGLFLSVAAKSV